MYSILLVDDEKSIREYLTKVIPFEEYGFTVKNTALNGKEALEKLPETCPDLILLDVRMPVMDGLEFLKLLRKSEYANTQVVILSGYDEFEYAKEAMKYGVKAYLNKPVDEEEILPLLEKVHKELDSYRREQDTSMIRQHMMMFNELYNGRDIARDLFKGYTYMSCVLLQYACNIENNNLHLIIQECIARQIGDIGNYLFRVKGSQYHFLLPPKVLKQYDYSKKALADKLSYELKKSNLDCAFLFDSYVFEHHKDTFREDITNHNYEMLTELFFSGGDFIDYSPDRYRIGGELFLELKYLENIKQCIASLDKKKAIQAIEELITEVQRKRIGIQYVQQISLRVYYLIYDEISKIVNIKQSESFLTRFTLMENSCFITFPKWKEMLCSLIMEGFELIEGSYGKANLCIVKEVIEYIHLYYMEQISLKQVADKFFVNAAYLGRIFKKTTGVSFKKYVNKVRISEAKKLLLQTDKFIYEIANQVGFTESSYFIIKFTQEVGKSPTEFRNETHV